MSIMATNCDHGNPTLSTGIFTDWAIFTLSGDIEIGDIYSDTGLVRGIGMYTESELYFEDDAVLNIHDLGAGMELYDVDTSELDHPYAPAEAKPFHVLYSWSTEDHTFYSDLYGDPSAVNVWCIAGRDSTSSDWDHSDFENLNSVDTDCSQNDESVMVRVEISVPISKYQLGDLIWLAFAVSVILAMSLYYKDSRKVSW